MMFSGAPPAAMSIYAALSISRASTSRPLMETIGSRAGAAMGRVALSRAEASSSRTRFPCVVLIARAGRSAMPLSFTDRLPFGSGAAASHAEMSGFSVCSISLRDVRFQDTMRPVAVWKLRPRAVQIAPRVNVLSLRGQLTLYSRCRRA